MTAPTYLNENVGYPYDGAYYQRGESNEGHSDELKRYLQLDCQNSHNQYDNELSPHKHTESQAQDANGKGYQGVHFQPLFPSIEMEADYRQSLSNV